MRKEKKRNMKRFSLPYNVISLLCFTLGVPLVLGLTWVLEKLIGKTFPAWLGIGLNLFSFVMTSIGFVYAILALWGDMTQSQNYLLLLARVKFLSLLALVSNGFWVLLYVVMIWAYLRGIL